MSTVPLFLWCTLLENDGLPLQESLYFNSPQAGLIETNGELKVFIDQNLSPASKGKNILLNMFCTISTFVYFPCIDASHKEALLLLYLSGVGTCVSGLTTGGNGA